MPTDADAVAAANRDFGFTPMVTVPAIDEMDNEIFLKHMDARHARDVINGPLSAHPDTADEWVGPYREFHERLHELAVPGQYDHEHLW